MLICFLYKCLCTQKTNHQHINKLNINIQRHTKNIRRVIYV